MEASGRTDPVCPICLEPLQREAYLDRCFHAFCYHCIVKWSKLVKEKCCLKMPTIKCPLCKVENLSVVYGFDGESFCRFYVNGDYHDSFFTSSHEFRFQCYNNKPGGIFNVQRYWKYHRYRQKNIWLPSWLRRDIQTLTKEEDVDIIVHHVHGVIESLFKSNKARNANLREMFKSLLADAARPFLGVKTERFVDELELFLASGLNIDAYDRVCMQHMGNCYSGDECDCAQTVDSGLSIMPNL